jgi:TrmH family RNA methyltransferase
VRDLPRLGSRRHPVVQTFREAASGRRRDDLVLLDGDHLVDEAIAGGVQIDVVLVDDARAAEAPRYRQAAQHVYLASSAVLAAASPVRTPSGVVALAAWTPSPIARMFDSPRTLAVGLVDVQDPGNVGGVIRSADALGASGVAALGASADPAGWKAMRGSMGSAFRVTVARGSVDEALEAASRAGVVAIATVAGSGVPLPDIDLRQPALVLFGNEGAGLPDDVIRRASLRVHVPMRAGVSSLNVGVPAALVLYAARRQRSTSGLRPEVDLGSQTRGRP